MPRIRKETSKRRSTNDRAKLRKKVKESKRKKSRDAKKSVQWKSKKAKDPGIPSEFPYKDQILAEVAEQRRVAAEEKERKKAEKQKALAKARAIARGEVFEDSDEEVNGEDEVYDGESPDKITNMDLNVGEESIASLSAKALKAELKQRPRPVVEVQEEEEEEVPILINRDLPNLKSVLEKADVVVELLDGRDPLASRSKNVEELTIELGKKLLLVMNKIDACPREAVAAWSQYLRKDHPTLLFRSASSFLPETTVAQTVAQAKKGKGKSRAPVNDAVGTESLLASLAHWSKKKEGDDPLFVAVIGIVNVGKSSFINSLLQRSALPIYTLASSSRGPTTTELPQEVSLEVEGQKITLIDTPGLSFLSSPEDDNTDHRVRDILLRSKGRIDRLKDPNPPILHITSRANAEDLMLLYNLPAFGKGDTTAFLSGVARSNHLVKKRGVLDLTGAARIVLRDWSVGKFARFTTPPSTIATATPDSFSLAGQDTAIVQLYANDEIILASLPTRKERRKAGGPVKLSSEATDTRKAAVEEGWINLEGSEDSEDSEDDEEDDADESNVNDMDLEDEEEEEEEEEEKDEESENEEVNESSEGEKEVILPILSEKQKRKRVITEDRSLERPTKKVTFAPPSKEKVRNPSTVKHTQAKTALKPSKHKSAAKPIIKTGKTKAANISAKKREKDSDGQVEEYDFTKFF